MINFDRVTNNPDKNARFVAANEELQKFTPDDPPYLSDIYVNLNKGGQTFLIALEAQEKREMRPGGKPYRWKIQVRKDEWGNTPQPGDKVVRVIPINRKDMDNQPVPSSEFNAALVDGSFSDRFEQRVEYEVDDKGCIECTFSDAGYFLFNWGIHGKTKRGICGKPELSSEPAATPGGGKLHVHYWRYAEVDSAMHKNLPPLTAGKTKKRGE